MKEPIGREVIAMRAAREFKDGYVVNLGTGIPIRACDFIPEGITVILHAENGILGYGPVVEQGGSFDLKDAGGKLVSLKPGMSFFSSAESFAMVRGGHLDMTVMGALQVSEKGDLANWKLPERGTGAVGGAMDLAAGAKRVVIVMEHTTKDGQPKVVRQCSYPLTARGRVNLVITDLAVIEVTPRGMLLREVAPGYSAEEVQAVTEPELIVSPDLKEIEL